MIATAVVLDFRRATELARNDKQNLVAQPSLMDIFQEYAYGTIDRPAQLLHAARHVELSWSTVHVPAGIVNRDESTTGFTQPSRQK